MTWNLSKALRPHRLTNRRPTTSNRRKARPGLEFLEGRALLATFTWTGAGGNNNWDNDANWQGGDAPTAASGPVDLVFPTTAANPTITLQNAQSDLQIQSLNIQGGNYKFEGPTAGGKLPLNLLANSTITFGAGARLDINPAATPDSLALKIQGAATMNGAGFFYLNTSTVTYPGNPQSLVPFTVNAGNLYLGASADLSKSLVTLAAGTNLVVINGASPTVGSISGSGNMQVGTNVNPTNTGLTVATPAGRTDVLSGSVSGSGGTLTKTGAGSFSLFRINAGSAGSFTLNVQAGNFGLQGQPTNAQQTTFAQGSTYTASLISSTSAARIVVPANGSINLGNSTLALALNNGYTPAVGDTFTLVSAPGGITGQFGNAAENATLSVAGTSLLFRVNYTSTAVTLTAVNAPNLIATTSTMTAMNPVTPGSTVTFQATVRDASNNPVQNKGYFSFWYTDDFQSWTQLGAWKAVGANGVATSDSRTLPNTYTAGAVVALFVDNQAPVQYRNSWTQDSGSILFPIVQWYNTNTALNFNSANNRLTATITSPQGTPTWLGKPFAGAVLFKRNGVVIGAAQIVNGVATFQLTSTPPRGTTYTAEYIPDAAFSVLGSTGTRTI